VSQANFNGIKMIRKFT